MGPTLILEILYALCPLKLVSKCKFLWSINWEYHMGGFTLFSQSEQTKYIKSKRLFIVYEPDFT